MKMKQINRLLAIGALLLPLLVLVQCLQASNLIDSNQKRKFHMKLQRSGLVDIPGLYDDHAGLMTPIQGEKQFNLLVLGIDSHSNISNSNSIIRGNSSIKEIDCTNKLELEQLANEQTISLVQFYMATCPDCQGFSPYFKRFVMDISPHWRSLVRIYTVNCNDFENIHLCQEENPKLIVPMVRWYAPPILQLAHHHQANKQKQFLHKQVSINCHKYLNYSKSLLNVAHRKFVDKQRRDLISLRKATLRFIDLMMDDLARKKGNSTESSLLDALPIRWHSLRPLGDNIRHHSSENSSSFNGKQSSLNELGVRQLDCAERRRRTNKSSDVIDVIVFEQKPSLYSLGRTIVADWSNWTMACEEMGVSAFPFQIPPEAPLLRVHWSSDFSLLNHLLLLNRNKTINFPTEFRIGSSDWQKISPIAISLRSTNSGIDLDELRFIAANVTNPAASRTIGKRHAMAQQHTQRLGRINQRASLQRYYSQNPATLSSYPVRYATTMAESLSDTLAAKRQNDLINKMVRNKRQTSDAQAQRQAEAEHINWAPELLWPKVEEMRHKINRAIAGQLNVTDWPGKLFEGKNPGELLIRRPYSDQQGVTISDLRDDDLSLMMLTDYYKSLDEIVHIDLIAKGELDGYQMLASTCFLSSLMRYFPFQGSAQAPESIGNKSISRYYLELLQRRWFGELMYKLVDKTEGSSLLNKFNNDPCPNLSEEKNLTAHLLEETKVCGHKLEEHQQELRKLVKVGLAPSNKLSWKYCAGSEPNLRGHTCSLWILFHTLTVQEYLDQTGDINVSKFSNFSDDHHQMVVGGNSNQTTPDSLDQIEYKFQIDYNRSPRSSCDPKNPEKAYLEWSSRELYVASNKRSVLANIINFVRFYLPCTNCAAHFSCMVEHSPGLNFNEYNGEQNQSKTIDWQLLWLWEAHNRVNLRTRATHSEDPLKPKHVFPMYEACPKCYLERPKRNVSEQILNELKFNRNELVRFIVARYRKSAILNNKINIEDLFRS